MPDRYLCISSMGAMRKADFNRDSKSLNTNRPMSFAAYEFGRAFFSRRD